MKKKDTKSGRKDARKPGRGSPKKSASGSTWSGSADTGRYVTPPPQGRPARPVRLVGRTIRASDIDRTPPPRDAAPSPPINRAAIALLRSWRQEDPEQQRAVWDTLKQTLDEDRLSDRERVP